MARDLCDLSAEVDGISAMITGLSNQIDEKSDSLKPEFLRLTLFGVSSHLDRIAEELMDIDVTVTETAN